VAAIRAASHMWPVHPDPDHLKTLTIEIAPGDLDRLRMSGFSLCFAKQVVARDGSNGFNVIWHAGRDYLRSNTISWVPRYELFTAHHFVRHIHPDRGPSQPIEFGQQSIVDRHGIPRTAVGTPGVIDMIVLNEFGLIHVGLSQLTTTMAGAMMQLPIYLGPRALHLGPAHLRPTENILVWFERNVESSMTFSAQPPGAVEIDFTGIDTATLRFAGDDWTRQP